MPGLPRFKAEEVAGISISILFAAATLLWVTLDRFPPNWDDAWYLTNSLSVYDSLTHHGIAGYVTKLNSVFGFKAPLIAALPAPFYLAFGRRWHAAYLVNIVCMLALFRTVFQIASHYWSRRAGVIAVAVAGTMPLLYGLSRWYLVEYPLTALLAAAIWLLIQLEVFERAQTLILLGVVCGLGLLLKVSFAIFILPLFLYRWAKSRHRLRLAALSGAPCLILALPWYAGHLLPTIRNALDAGFGQSASIQGTGPILALSTVLKYLSHIVVNGTSVYYAVLAGLLLLWSASSRPRREIFLGAWKSAGPVVLLWFLPFLLFLFGGNKDIRYIAPLLPGCALLAAGLLDGALPRNLTGSAMVFLILAAPATQMLAVSFGVPYRSPELTYSRLFLRTPWPHDPMLRAIAAGTSVKAGEKEMLLVGADRAPLNANNVELTVVALDLPFSVETTAHEPNLETLRPRLAQASYFLYKEGGEPESAAINPYSNELVRLATADPSYREVFSTPLPDGGVARILKHLAPASHSATGEFVRQGGRDAPEPSIVFAGMFGLTDISVATTANAVTVRFRWVCLKRPGREYWRFTHLIDAENRIVSQLDQRLLGGNPPLTSWMPGDAGTEEIHLPIAANAGRGEVRLRFGLYYPPTGERLPVAPLKGSAAARFTLADQTTAVLSN